MARNTIVPLANLNRRPPEAGRIRLGAKSGKAMKALDKFRFTSPREDLLGQLAVLYGGTVRPWSDPKAAMQNQYELFSNADRLNVWLIPGGMSINYEAWSGGGCIRRCDGITCEITIDTPDGNDVADVDCLCVAQRVRLCNPHSRLQVILPELDFAGVWRFESKGWNAAAELPGMFDMITQLGEQGTIVKAELSVENRSKMGPKGKKNFIVPKLSIAQSVLEIQSGMANAMSIGEGSAPVATPALGSGAPALALVPDVDDDIADADLIDDELLALEQLLRADALNFGMDPDRYVAAVRRQAGDDYVKIQSCIDQVRAESLVPLAFTAAGAVQWGRPRG